MRLHVISYEIPAQCSQFPFALVEEGSQDSKESWLGGMAVVRLDRDPRRKKLELRLRLIIKFSPVIWAPYFIPLCSEIEFNTP